MKVAICIKLKMLEVGDSADNKSDSIPIDLKEFRFDSIRFTGCVVVARGQVMVLGGGEVANPKFLTVKNCEGFSSQKMFVKKCLVCD